MIPVGTVKVVLLPVHAKFVVTARAGDARPSEVNATDADARQSAVRRRKDFLPLNQFLFLISPDLYQALRGSHNREPNADLAAIPRHTCNDPSAPALCCFF